MSAEVEARVRAVLTDADLVWIVGGVAMSEAEAAACDDARRLWSGECGTSLVDGRAFYRGWAGVGWGWLSWAWHDGRRAAKAYARSLAKEAADV